VAEYDLKTVKLHAQANQVEYSFCIELINPTNGTQVARLEFMNEDTMCQWHQFMLSWPTNASETPAGL